MVHVKMLELFGPCEELVRLGRGRAQREAYIMFMDLLVVFARALRRNPQLSSLVYVPEASLQRTLQVRPSSGDPTLPDVLDHVIHLPLTHTSLLSYLPLLPLSSRTM